MKINKLLAAAIGVSLFCATAWGAEPNVTIHVQDTPVRTVLSGLAKLGNVNLIVDDTVQGSMTVSLQDIPFDEALGLIAESQNLYYTNTGGVRVITAGRTGGGSGKSLRVFTLQYADVRDVKTALQAMLPEKSVQCHDETNTLIAYADNRETSEISRLLKQLDVAGRQVKLEVEVVAVNKENMDELGIEWNWLAGPNSADYSRETWSEQRDLTDSDGNTLYDDSGQARTRTYTHDAWKTTTPSGYGAISYGRSLAGHPYAFFYQAKLNALVVQGKANILAKPYMMTLNGREGKILIGDRIPVLTEHVQNGQTTTTTEYTEAGIKLNYKPQINEQGDITATVHAEVSTPVLVPEMKAYHIITRQVETKVRMHDGQTMVIGGLIDKEDTKNFRKVPFLGDLPILGALFRSTYHSKKETEVLLFLTAEIVKPGRESQVIKGGHLASEFRDTMNKADAAAEAAAAKIETVKAVSNKE